MEVPRFLGGRYRLLRQLGSGGMAVVWLARDEVLNRTVAVKVLAGEHAGDPRPRQQIRDEARAAAALSHPNIAQVYDYGESPVVTERTERSEGHEGATKKSTVDGVAIPYVVMEFIRGGTLQQHLAAQTVTPKVAMRLCAEVAAALAAAHAEGLVHRDIKPANVMVTPAGAKVVDFGIAAIRQAGSGRRDAEVLGTPAYLAPERLTNDAVDPACDVYSLGVLLYVLLSGRSPWNAETTTQMLNAHVYVEPDPLPPMPDVPDVVVRLCQRCLRKDPAQRPTAREVAAVLAAAAGLRVIDAESEDAPAMGLEPAVLIRRDPATRPAGAVEPDATTAVAAPARRRRARTLLVVAAALIAALTLAGWLLSPGSPRTTGSDAAPPPGGAHASPRISTDASARPGSRPTEGGPGPAPGGTATDGTRGQAGGLGAPTATSPGPSTAPATPSGTAPTPSPTTPPTMTSPPPVERTFQSAGGTVHATCPSADIARLLSWRAAAGYRVDGVQPGPGATASATFRHGQDRVTMTVTCRGGEPSAATSGS